MHFHDRGFTLLQTYKVLKLSGLPGVGGVGFTLLQTYKVLKHVVVLLFRKIVLHSYKLTRFSNNQCKSLLLLSVLHSYKLTRFSNLNSI